MEICQEKFRLAEEYKKATALYSQNLNEFVGSMGVVPKVQYESLRTATEEARHATANARGRLERHIAEHGC